VGPWKHEHAKNITKDNNKGHRMLSRMLLSLLLLSKRFATNFNDFLFSFLDASCRSATNNDALPVPVGCVLVEFPFDSGMNYWSDRLTNNYEKYFHYSFTHSFY
jgi:hypothetical protein